MMNKNRENFVTTEDMKEIYGLHFTLKMNGKMSGMQSLSTSVLENPFCKKYRLEEGSICSKCYAATQMKCYINMQACFARNTEVLTKQIIPIQDWALLNAAFFRLEAFGDLNNVTQVINYFNLCKANPQVNFALWTKTPALIQAAINKGYKKPKNLQVVLSSKRINEVAEIKHDFIDKVFTVYDKEYIKEHNVDINCGKKKCLACRKCYTKNKLVFINEELK